MVVGTMGMIYSDTRQKPGHHDIKEKWWAEHGIELERVALTVNGHVANQAVAPAGDYCAEGSNVCVDTKASVDEVAGNINGKEHERFIAEIERAAAWGYRLVILVENELGYANMGDVLRWTNGHCVRCHKRRVTGKARGCNPNGKGKCPRHGTRKPIQGARLYKAMDTIERRYGCRFEFCAPDESARRICELLGVTVDERA